MELIKLIKVIQHKFESQQNIHLLPMDNAKCIFCGDEMKPSWASKFKNTTRVIEHFRGNVGNCKVPMLEGLKSARKGKTTTTKKDKREARAITLLAIAFLKRANRVDKEN